MESASLPVATFAKFQPHSTEFLDMTNPKAVLEARLRNFACLSTGDVIAIMYNNKIYELSVLETKPSNAVSVIGEYKLREVPSDQIMWHYTPLVANIILKYSENPQLIIVS